MRAGHRVGRLADLRAEVKEGWARGDVAPI